MKVKDKYLRCMITPLWFSTIFTRKGKIYGFLFAVSYNIGIKAICFILELIHIHTGCSNKSTQKEIISQTD